MLGQPKVCHLEAGRGCIRLAQQDRPIQQQVVRLEVEVDDLHLVQVRHAVDGVERQLSAHAQGNEAALGPAHHHRSAHQCGRGGYISGQEDKDMHLARQADTQACRGVM